MPRHGATASSPTASARAAVVVAFPALARWTKTICRSAPTLSLS